MSMKNKPHNLGGKAYNLSNAYTAAYIPHNPTGEVPVQGRSAEEALSVSTAMTDSFFTPPTPNYDYQTYAGGRPPTVGYDAMAAETRRSASKYIDEMLGIKQAVKCEKFKGELSILNDRNILSRAESKFLYEREWDNAFYKIVDMYRARTESMLTTEAIITAAKLRLNTINRKTVLTKIVSIINN